MTDAASYDSLDALLTARITAAVRDAMGERGMSEAMPEKQLLRVREVCELVGLSDDTVRRLIDEGTIPSRELPGIRGIFVATTDLKAWVESLPRRNVA